jgi:hypothetical protein
MDTDNSDDVCPPTKRQRQCTVNPGEEKDTRPWVPNNVQYVCDDTFENYRWHQGKWEDALVALIFEYNFDLLRIAVETQPHLDLRQPYTKLLDAAVIYCNRSAARYLMKQVNLPDYNKLLGMRRSLLKLAIVCGKGLAPVRAAVAADPSCVNAWYRHSTAPPLIWAAQANRLDVVRYLVQECGVDVNETPRYDGSFHHRALDMAAERDHYQIVQWLVVVGKSNVWRATVSMAGRRSYLWLLTLPGIDQFNRNDIDFYIQKTWDEREHTQVKSLDFHQMRLGNSACALVATCYSFYRVAWTRLDDNPRIGHQGVQHVIRGLQSYVYPTSKKLKRIRMSDLSVSDYCALRTQGHISNVEIECPFPSLVTIVSVWIADYLLFPFAP